jgi:hypothetical protein
MFELEVLGDWTSIAAIAAGNLYRPTALAGNAELDRTEVAEVVYLEIIPPVTGLGVVEDLRNVRLILDGKEHPWININGTDTFLMAPPYTNIFKGGVIKFGTPLVDAVKTGSPLLLNSCPKYAHELRVQAQAGVGGITANFRIRAWGYRYETDQINRLLGDSVGGSFSVIDTRNNRTLDQFKIPVVPSVDTWTQLPGGQDQAVPKINFLYRYAFNANATTVNTPYQFRYDVGNVALDEENMRFEFDRVKSALIIQGLGVRAPANLLQTFFNIDGWERPDRRYPTQQNNNPFHFGLGTPLLPAGIPMYHAVRELDKPYLIWNEIGYLASVDAGVAVPANNIAVSVYGVMIEMSSTGQE